jgi:hypothetical protein
MLVELPVLETWELAILGFYTLLSPLLLTILIDFWLLVYVNESRLEWSGVNIGLLIIGEDGFLFNAYGLD